MIGAGGAREGRKGRSGSVDMAFAGLFPASDSDDEQDYPGPQSATSSAKKGGTAHAHQDWSLFPDKEEALVQPAAAPAKSGRRSKNRAASGVTGLSSGSTPAREKVAGGKGEQNPGWGKKKKKTKNPSAVVKGDGGNTIPSPLHTGVDDDDDDENDLEAACGTRSPSLSKSVDERAIDEFEVRKQGRQNRV